VARSRSIEAHEKVLRAALGLFGERGIDATSMDAIAQASGVSKATIYKHWADKEALLLEVMIFINGLDREPEDVDSGDLCADLATVLSRRPPDRFDADRDRIMPTMIAYSAVHPEFGRAWRQRAIDPARQCLRRILLRAVDRGLLPAALDEELSMPMLLGPMLYTHIFHTRAGTKGRDISAQVAAAFCRAHALKARSKSAEKSGKR
jgi:AcrR family transcriptional regulator